MNLTKLKPGYLYGFLESINFDSSNPEEKWESALESQTNESISEYHNSHLVNVVNYINEFVLKEDKIDPRYIWEDAPVGYFKKIGQKLLDDNYSLMDVIAYKFVKVIEKIHDEKANNFRYALGFGLYIENGKYEAVECLPFQYGGIYNVKRVANSLMPFFLHMGFDLLDLDYNYNLKVSPKMEQGVNDYVQEYIDENSIYRFSHAVNELKYVEFSYDPIKVENAPAGKEKYFQRRIDEMKDEYYGRKLIKIVGKVNPVFGENFWIPGDDE